MPSGLYPRRHLVAQCPEALDLDAHGIAGLKEPSLGAADAGAGAGRHDVAGLERDLTAQGDDLLAHVEHHLARMGILFMAVVVSRAQKTRRFAR